MKFVNCALFVGGGLANILNPEMVPTSVVGGYTNDGLMTLVGSDGAKFTLETFGADGIVTSGGEITPDDGNVVRSSFSLENSSMRLEYSTWTIQMSCI
eukprot:Trichotokara_eunicae@DN10910_c0_g1_i1.p1